MGGGAFLGMVVMAEKQTGRQKRRQGNLSLLRMFINHGLNDDVVNCSIREWCE